LSNHSERIARSDARAEKPNHSTQKSAGSERSEAVGGLLTGSQGDNLRRMTPVHAAELEVRRYLDGLRLQLWWREGLVRVSRGVAAGALLGLGLLGVAVWSARPAGAYAPVAVAAVVAAASLAFALGQRPTRLRAARQADQQGSLRNRLATAAEILEGRISSDLGGLQLADTALTCAALPGWRAFPHSTVAARNAALVGTAALAALVVALLMVAAPLAPTQAPAAGLAAEQASSAAAEKPEAMATAAIVASPRQLQQARTRSVTEQAALAQLADHLRQTAAARDVGQALQRGDVAAASILLNQLAQDSDQLSQTAKQELAGALLDASRGTSALDKQLAAAELAATVAMTRADYQAARAALQNLVAAVVTAQTGTLTQQQLIEQIQQLERQAALAGNGSDCGVLTDDGEFFQDCSAAGQSPSSGAMGVASKGVGQSPTAGVGEVAGGHGFATSGVDLDPLGQAPTHVVSLPAADVPVDLSLSSGQGNGTPSDQHAPTMAISQSSQHDVHQTGGQPSAEPGIQEAERTVVASSERALVRDFFRLSATDGTPP
jgi:hypothetical protein